MSSEKELNLATEAVDIKAEDRLPAESELGTERQHWAKKGPWAWLVDRGVCYVFFCFVLCCCFVLHNRIITGIKYHEHDEFAKYVPGLRAWARARVRARAQARALRTRFGGGGFAATRRTSLPPPSLLPHSLQLSVY